MGKVANSCLFVDWHRIVDQSLNSVLAQVLLKAIAVITLYDEQMVVWNTIHLRFWRRGKPFLQFGSVALSRIPAAVIPGVQMR